VAGPAGENGGGRSRRRLAGDGELKWAGASRDPPPAAGHSLGRTPTGEPGRSSADARERDPPIRSYARRTRRRPGARSCR
jgi:hypothetical protein